MPTNMTFKVILHQDMNLSPMLHYTSMVSEMNAVLVQKESEKRSPPLTLAGQDHMLRIYGPCNLRLDPSLLKFLVTKRETGYINV
jgi:hypothetical protein